MAGTIDKADFRRVMSHLTDLDKKMINELRKEMRKEIQPELKRIRNFIKGAESRLRAPGSSSGEPAKVFSDGRTGWSGANVSLGFRPGKYRGAILTIQATGKKKQVGYNYAEMANTAGGQSQRGQAFGAMLNKRFDWSGKGRFLYRGTINQVDTIYYKVAKVLFRYAKKVNIDLERSSF